MADSWPTELRLDKDKRVLTVSFDDGKSFALPAELLRVLSPSAEVQGHSEAQRVTVAGKKNVGIARIEPVGNYAVRIVFDDGHDTGLFVWDYLRELGENKEARWQGYLNDLAAKTPLALRAVRTWPPWRAARASARCRRDSRSATHSSQPRDDTGSPVRSGSSRTRVPPRAPILAHRSPWQFPHRSPYVPTGMRRSASHTRR